MVTLQNSIGILFLDAGRQQEAEDAYREALAVAKRLTEEFPGAPGYHTDLAGTHNELGILLANTDRTREAEHAYRDALAIYKQLTTELPAFPEYRHNLAGSHNNLGLLLKATGRLKEAEDAYREAVLLQKQLAAEFPAVPSHRLFLSRHHRSLGKLLQTSGRHQEAEEAYRAGRALLKELTAEFPEVPGYREELAMCHSDISVLLWQRGRGQEAEAHCRDGITLQTQLAAKFPAVPGYRHQQGSSHNLLGVLLADSGRLQEAEQSYRAALVLRQALAREYPTAAGYPIDLGGTQCNLGNLVAKQEHPHSALEWYAQAIATLEPVSPKETRNSTAQEFLRNSHWGRALALAQLGRNADALKDYDRALELDDERNHVLRLQRALLLANLKDHAQATAEANALSGADNADASTLYEAAAIYAVSESAVVEDPKRADDYATRALELMRRAVSKGYQNVEYIKHDTRLEHLRSHPLFQKFLKELELSAHREGSKPKPKLEFAAGRTQDALVDLATRSAAKPNDTLLLLELAALQAWFGQEKELADTCRRGLELAKNTTVPETAERVAKVCCLLPSTDKAQHEAALALARKAVELGKGNQNLPWFQMTLGIAEYRSGHFAEADAALIAAAQIGKDNFFVAGPSALYRAMSLFRQGKEDEARKRAIEAASKMKPLPKDEKDPLAGNAYHNDLILWMAYKEAKALIQFEPAPAATHLTGETGRRPLPEKVVKSMPAVGTLAPEVAAKEWINTEKPPRLADLRDNFVLVEFWATWCGPCVQNIPHLNGLHEQYGPKDLRILSFTDQSRKAIEPFLRQTPVHYSIGAGSDMAAQYGVAAIPHAFLIGKDGKILWHGHPADKELERKIKAALEHGNQGLKPKWEEPDHELRTEMKAAYGTLTENFAFCQKMRLEKLITFAKRLSKCGYRPIRVRPYQVGKVVEAAAIWTRDGRAWEIVYGLTGKKIDEYDGVLQDQGYVIEDVASYGDHEFLYVGIWAADNAKKGDDRLVLGLHAAKHQKVFESLAKQAYIPYTIQSTNSAGGLFYTQVFRNAPLDSWEQRVGLSEQAFMDFAARRLLRDVSIAKEQSGRLIFGAIRQASKDFASMEAHYANHDEHFARCLALIEQGYRPVSIAVQQTEPDHPKMVASVWHRSIAPGNQ